METKIHPNGPDTWIASNEAVEAILEKIDENHPIYRDHPDLIGEIYLKDIHRIQNNISGRASDVLRTIVQWADDNHKTIILLVRPQGRKYKSLRQLEDWYQKYGFVDFYGRMIRRPQ